MFSGYAAYFCLILNILLSSSNSFIFFSAIAHPLLRKFYLNCIQKAHSFVDRTFHSPVTLHRLSTYGLGPVPTNVVLAHELTTHRHKFFTFLHNYLFIHI